MCKYNNKTHPLTVQHPRQCTSCRRTYCCGCFYKNDQTKQYNFLTHLFSCVFSPMPLYLRNDKLKGRNKFGLSVLKQKFFFDLCVVYKNWEGLYSLCHAGWQARPGNCHDSTCNCRVPACFGYGVRCVSRVQLCLWWFNRK